MKKTDLEKVKGSFYIYSNGEYVVLAGSKLYVFRPDGALVARRDDVRYSGRITFLSGNRMLLCTGNAMLHMIDLTDGSDIWSAPYVKSHMNTSEFALSPDEAFAYSYDNGKHGPFISRIDLHTQDVYCHDLQMDIGATLGILCDSEGIPCMLKSLTETIGGICYHQTGVRIHDYHSISPGDTTTWKTKWSFDGNTLPLSFWISTDNILTTDLRIFDPASGTFHDLLERDEFQNYDLSNPISCWQDSAGQYLCVMYQNSNVVIDISARKVAAQYAANFQRGCLVGKEYWVCVDGKIHRKSFPAFEEVPPAKVVGGTEWFYTKYPELW